MFRHVEVNVHFYAASCIIVYGGWLGVGGKLINSFAIEWKIDEIMSSNRKQIDACFVLK